MVAAKCMGLPCSWIRDNHPYFRKCIYACINSFDHMWQQGRFLPKSQLWLVKFLRFVYLTVCLVNIGENSWLLVWLGGRGLSIVRLTEAAAAWDGATRFHHTSQWENSRHRSWLRADPSSGWVSWKTPGGTTDTSEGKKKTYTHKRTLEKQKISVRVWNFRQLIKKRQWQGFKEGNKGETI